VELHADHQILVDYNMGVRVNLVDREIFQVNPSMQKAYLTGTSASTTDDSVSLKQLEELKQSLLNEKDKFILSDKETLPTFDKTEKEIEQSLAKHAILLKQQME
jgi:hypothetical protein